MTSISSTCVYFIFGVIVAQAAFFYILLRVGNLDARPSGYVYPVCVSGGGGGGGVYCVGGGENTTDIVIGDNGGGGSANDSTSETWSDKEMPDNILSDDAQGQVRMAEEITVGMCKVDGAACVSLRIHETLLTVSPQIARTIGQQLCAWANTVDQMQTKGARK